MPTPARKLRQLAALALLLVGCQKRPENATPEGAARELMSALEGIAGDPTRSKQALRMLGPVTLKNLETRAARASKVEGRTISSADYLAASRYLPRTRVAKVQSELNVSQDQAALSLLDANGSEVTRLAAAKVGEVWLLELGLPELPPLPKR